MDCVACHTPLPADARFCMACGADVTDPGATIRTKPRDATAELQERLERTLAGRYEVRRLLGAGGMAAVFLADEIGLDRPVAIKVLPPELSRDEGLVARFQREARTAAKLDHPHIIPIHRVESEAGLHYFVMKYVPGRSLEDLLEAPEPLPIDAAVRILREAAGALGHAHARGVVHRDVKPANIMLDADDRVVLTDFGISKAGESSSLTQTGTIIGTPHYMAPEQALGIDVDGRADQYALGVVAYHMLTRQCPFTGDSAHTIIYRHIHEPPKPVASLRPDVPTHVADAIAVALAKDPADRFATMEELARALGGDATVLPARAPRPATAVGQPTPSRVPTVALSASDGRPAARPRRALAWSALAIAVALIAVASLVVSRRGTETENMLVAESSARSDSAVARSATPDSVPPASLLAVADSTPAVTASPAPVPRRASEQSSAEQAAEGIRPPAAGTRPRAEGRLAVEGQQSPAGRPARALLTVASEPYGTLFIDDVEIGDTPVANHPLEVGRRYRVRVEREGYRPKRETIDVKGPNPIRLRYFLEPGGQP